MMGSFVEPKDMVLNLDVVFPASLPLDDCT